MSRLKRAILSLLGREVIRQVDHQEFSEKLMRRLGLSDDELEILVDLGMGILTDRFILTVESALWAGGWQYAMFVDCFETVQRGTRSYQIVDEDMLGDIVASVKRGFVLGTAP
jgi:hypothetical protein